MNGSRLDYQLDGDAPLTETNQTTAQVNLYGNGLVMSGGETLLPDGLGATRQTTSSSQSVVWTGTSQAFGVPLASSGSTVNHYQWGAGSGYRSDGFGPTYASPLLKVGARYYDPEFGCFLTRDTDLSQSPYAYCDGDPVNFSDPSGHNKKKDPPKSGAPTPSGPGGTGSGGVGGGAGSDGKGNAGPTTIPTSDGGSVTVGTSGGGLDLSYTQSPETTSIHVDNSGNIKKIGESGVIPLGGILAGLGATFSGSYNTATGAGIQSVGLSYKNGGFTAGGSMSSDGGFMGSVGYQGSF